MREQTFIERLCVALTCMALVPVWLYPWFPSQDGPSHLYNAMLLVSSGPTTSAVFERVVAIFPNWTAYILLAALGRLFTPFVALKIVVSLCVAAIPAATLYLQKSYKGAADPTALLGVLLAFSYLLFMGFYNFILGCALFAWTIGYRRRRRTTTPVVGLYLLLTLCYLTHGFAFSATVLSLALLAVIERRRLDLLVLLPPAAVAVLEAWPRLHGRRGYEDLAWHLKRLGALDTFAYFRAVHANIATAISVLLVVAVVVTLRRKRDWPPIALSATLLALFFITPWAYTAGRSYGGWLSERFLLLFVMTLPAWLDLPRPRLVLALMTVLAAAHITTTWGDVARVSAEVDAIVRCRDKVPEHSTLAVAGQPPRIVTKLEPLRHAPAYLAVGRDVAYLSNYEAELDDFPIRFRSAQRPPPDFLLLWSGAPASGRVVCQGAGFRVVAMAR